MEVAAGGGGSTGVVWICDGATVTATNDISFIGHYGVGAVTVSNSTVQMAALTLGQFYGIDSRGTLTVAGGTVTLSGTLTAAEQEQYGAPTKASIWVTDGQLIATNAPSYIGLKGTGQMDISN